MTDFVAVRRILNANPIWCAYAMADLQPTFAPYSHWYPACSAAGEGLVLLFTALKPTVLFTTGPAEAIVLALQQAELPDQIYMTAGEEHLPALVRVYDFRDDVRPMWRMALTTHTEHTHLPSSLPARLTNKDSERLRHLYQHGGPFTPDAFDPYQLENGVFFGVSDTAGELVAAGGTHIVDWQAGVAAIGNMYTRPDRRGRGYGSAIVQAIVTELRQGHVNRIVLNVDQRNDVARRLYERLGFAIHCSFLEGVGILRQS